MRIEKIQVSNFKSFENLDVDLEELNIIIGPNAAGKSNFLEILNFIRDISDWGLNNAISMQGGQELLQNFNLGASEKLSLRLKAKIDYSIPRIIENQRFDLNFVNLDYRFSIMFTSKGKFNIVKDLLLLDIRLEFDKKNQLEDENARIESQETQLIIEKEKDRVKFEYKQDKDTKGSSERFSLSRNTIEEIFPYLKHFREDVLSENSLLIEENNFVLILGFPFFQHYSSYDFDLKLIKEASPITGFSELVEDGSNLAIVLKGILEDENLTRKLLNLLQDLLPFIEDLEVEKFPDTSLFLILTEIYSKNKQIPAQLISDGTINIIALIIALYFDERKIIFIEEPEKCVHPYLISKIVEMLKDASLNKQIFVTTHNPLFVKFSELNTILYVERDNQGFSNIYHLGKKERIRKFLENEMGIDSLFVDNLLGDY